MINDEDLYCSLDDAVKYLNTQNPSCKIEQKDIFHCAALNLISLQLHYNSYLRLTTDDKSGGIGTYLYNGPVEIQDYVLGSERAYGNFETFKVMPLDIQFLHPDQNSSPTIDEFHLAAPYYFATFSYAGEIANDDGCYPIRNGFFVETSDLIFHTNELPKLNDAIIKFKYETEKRHEKLFRYTLEEAAIHLRSETNESEDAILKMLIKAVESRAISTYEPGSSIKYECANVRIYHEEIVLTELYEWMQINENLVACKLKNPLIKSQNTHDHPAIRNPVELQQDNAILNWLRINKYNPLKLAVPPKGKSGIKKICRDCLVKNSKSLFSSDKRFDAIWERLRKNKQIQDYH